MDISQLYRNLVRHAPIESSKSLELRAGQVVRGVMVQVLNGQEAIVQIEGMQVRAKLEAPLKQGQATFLQVQPESTTGQLVLKPIDANQQPLSNASLTQLLTSLHMKNDELNRMIVQLLRREGLPLSAEQIRLFRSTINFMPQQVDPSRWLLAAAVAQHKGLPLSKGSISALHQVMDGPSLQRLSEQLLQQTSALLQQPETNGVKTARPIINQLLQALASLRATMQFPAKLAVMTSGNHQAEMVPQQTTSTTIQDSRGMTTSQPGLMATNQAPVNQVVSDQMGASPSSHPSTARPSMGSGQVASNPLVQGQTQQDSGSAASTQPSALAMLAQRPMDSMAKTQSLPPSNSNPASQQVDSSVQAGADRTINSNESNRAGQGMGTTTETNEAQRASLTAASNQGGLAHPAGQLETSWITRMMKLLGLETERHWMHLANSTGTRGASSSTATSTAPMSGIHVPLPMDPSQVTHPAETVKSLLQQLLSLDDLPQSLRETAQHMQQHITGQQLMLTSDRNSLFTQWTLVIPLATEHGDQQAAIHIQSRRKGEHGMDASNCRLLFDLEMDHLGNTLIDVQVVERTVSIHLHNNHPAMPLWMSAAKSTISDALEQLGYRCAIWKCEPYPNQDELSTTASKEAAISLDWSNAFQPYKGVDLRI